MKFTLLFIALLALPNFALAETKVIGNGGDVREENPVSVAYIQSLMPKARLMIRSWLQGLDGQIHPDDGLRGRYPRQLPVPRGAEKLFAQSRDAYSYLDSEIRFKTEAPCGSADKHSDGSVVSESPAVICISGFSMSRKLNEGNAKIQLEALIVHEIAHLTGATEEEAIAIQSQYLSDMRFVSEESLAKMYDARWEALSSASYTLADMTWKRANLDEICELVYSARTVLGTAGMHSDVTPAHFLPARERDQLNDLDIWVGQVLHAYACGLAPKNPHRPWYDDYVKGFDGKERVTLFEFQKNRGLDVYRKTLSVTLIDRIRDDESLLKNLVFIRSGVDEISQRLSAWFFQPFNVTLDESK